MGGPHVRDDEDWERQLSDNCILYNNEDETSAHHFFECQFSNELWLPTQVTFSSLEGIEMDKIKDICYTSNNSCKEHPFGD